MADVVDPKVIELLVPGPQGAPGAVIRGVYDATVQYEPRDGVSFNGSSYFTLVPVIGVAPPASPWHVLAAKGDQGIQGIQGIAGPKGDKGDEGPQGAQGPQGLQGAAGPKGDKGDTGLQGIQGDTGAAGAQGIQGPKGDQGNTGATGTQGIQGLKGDKGDTGATGATGADGAQGIQGAAGPKGDQGVAGPTGADGAQGIQGVKGDKGDTGAAGAAGADGAQGIQGVKGDKGDTGAAGAAGAAGAQGIQGIQGAKGDKGDTGASGADGAQGIQGVKGDKGDTGATGATGADGAQGIQGPQGVAGPQGAVGPEGPQGLQGNDGAAGPQGPAGSQGVQGATGPAGATLVVTGPYSNATVYSAGQVVTYNGSAYYLVDGYVGTITGIVPPTAPWQLFTDVTTAATAAQTAAAGSATAAAGSATAAAGSATAVANAFTSLGPETGFQGGFVDSIFQLSFGAKLDGSFYAPKWATNMIPGAALKAGTVTYSAFDSATVVPYLLQALPPESGLAAAILDQVLQYALSVRLDGSISIPKLLLPNGAVSSANLAAGLLSMIMTPLPPESGYQGAFLDNNFQVGFGVKTDGSVVGKFQGLLSAGSVTTVYLGAGAVTEAKLDGPIARTAVPHLGDLIEVMPDNWRARYSQIGCRTATDGTYWTPLPPAKVTSLRGVNKSGTSIVFRRSARLSFRGKRYGSAFDLHAVANVNSTNLIGPVTSATLTGGGPSTAGRAAGDYYRYYSVANVTFNAQTVNLGDLIVFDGTAYRVQKAPTPIGSSDPTTRAPGDWWVCSTAGTFDGKAYAIGDRIVYIGYDSYAGSGYALWYKGQPVLGEQFYFGEFNPGTGFTQPGGVTISDGDVWQASASGTDVTTGLTFVAGDYLVRDTATWGVVTNSAQVTVANNALIPALTCYSLASEWEFRRADKSGARVAVFPTARTQRSPKAAIDNILILGDSMPGVANLSANLGGLVAPRTVTVVSRGGGTGENVLSTFEDFIANGGDPYTGLFAFLWPNQNNSSGTWDDINWSQAQEIVLKIVALQGSEFKRTCVLSVLGTKSYSWNGSRLVSNLDEAWSTNAYGPQGYEGWLDSILHGQWLSVNGLLRASADYATIQDTRVPAAAVGGTQLTESQTAASSSYGWVPQSASNQINGPWPFTVSQVALKGYWNSDSLPTGGADFDCWTRNGNGGVAGQAGAKSLGDLLVRVSGTWAEYQYDSTHLNPNTGGVTLAKGMQAYLSRNVL